MAAAADKPNGSEGESSNGAFNTIGTGHSEMSSCDVVADGVMFQLIPIVLLLLINKSLPAYHSCVASQFSF